ncbi:MULTISPECIES: hypothetical protein [Acidobacterium]|uniref:Uncharacterized protein n=1 Tax=Acidobacterium capsulatum (strain ATCC 51196 / DSM 11244 / BCRC 80197 / JCM 7670 / NBRC 15755 / NCIMB 13165 / 161) TaxID=240015 RepID=C1FA02_ACIC5|nr:MULTISPECIES: hypothetical protein [Acidobacterium]ACO33170.1 hypothetical protein ACP_0380 [Acidobacterium capsulatum ATCC 51196]HCT62076.1 hypothetical protein [Acidobacterium sp.]
MAESLITHCNGCNAVKANGAAGWSYAALRKGCEREGIAFAASKDPFTEWDPADEKYVLREDIVLLDICGSDCQHKVLNKWSAGGFAQAASAA